MGCVFVVELLWFKFDPVGLHFIWAWCIFLNDTNCEMGCVGSESYGPCRSSLLY
jgi:hypothetical protein